jgi:hypothetical protein
VLAGSLWLLLPEPRDKERLRPMTYWALNWPEAHALLPTTSQLLNIWHGQWVERYSKS